MAALHSSTYIVDLCGRVAVDECFLSFDVWKQLEILRRLCPGWSHIGITRRKLGQLASKTLIVDVWIVSVPIIETSDCWLCASE